jgi:hypothetical protein
MTDKASGSASMPADMDFLEPDYDHLDRTSFSSETASLAKKDEDDLCKKGESVTPEYILGTLVVRVVAARYLEVRVLQPGKYVFDP